MTLPSQFPRAGLYALADTSACALRGLDPLRVLEKMLAAGLPWVQLRAKDLGDEEALQLLGKAAQLPRSGSRLVMNDRADLAHLGGADAVHVGQDDLTVGEVRSVFPELACGISTHNLEQLDQALALRPTYVAFGPVFSTVSKKNPDPVTGLEALRQAGETCRKSGVPLVAIGGVSDDNLEQVAKHCDFVAAISLLLPAAQIEDPYGWIESRCREVNARISACHAGLI